jgi:hypothetical protein
MEIQNQWTSASIARAVNHRSREFGKSIQRVRTNSSTPYCVDLEHVGAHKNRCLFSGTLCDFEQFQLTLQTTSLLALRCHSRFSRSNQNSIKRRNSGFYEKSLNIVKAENY